MQRKAYILIGVIFHLVTSQGRSEESKAAMAQVLQIARGIASVQPHLKNAQYVKFAISIHRASRHFGIEPAVLIAIAQQESGFRENLPMGPAGEIGVCQILRSWLSNPNFIEEFGVRTVEDLKNSRSSFFYAAWLLRDLKDTVRAGSLPYWSFYNSRRFENRFKYFLRVNQKLATIRKHAPEVFAMNGDELKSPLRFRQELAKSD